MSGLQRLEEIVSDIDVEKGKLWLPGDGNADLELFSQLSESNFDIVRSFSEGSE